MQDYIPLGSNAFEEIYQFKAKNNLVYIAVDLRWPDFSLDESYSRYFLSWHTEQLDTQWLLKQADLVYPKPIMVAYDTDVINDYYPDNVQFVKWNTWGLQLSLAVGKDEDLHGHPAGYEYLDKLDFNLSRMQINFSDTYSWSKNNPIDNVNWRLDPGHNGLVTLTNESFHYSNTIIDNIETQFPGPYLTEKTWKPLLGGRPFISVGQCRSLKVLNEIGFNTNFGWDNQYDNDCGDLTRIGKIFNTILEINDMSINEIYEQSRPAVLHNTNHIKSGQLLDVCNEINLQTKQVIEDFVNG
jgi:hypothetical protein